MLGIPHYLDNRLTGTGRALLARNIIFLFLELIYVKRLSKPQGLMRPEGFGKLK
jgi:hypothetical protein